ncbi:hypothetical protein C8R47DRAFT_1133954 [Mycena vitilis]|nr:hypothetical protein C8R47DRAFT_1133954 [Mycena vitilis]
MLSLSFLLLLPFHAVQSAQVPLVSGDDWSLNNAGDDWNLNTLPNVNSTGHLVFDTISSLLQHWPNTKYHSGHNIVPGTIPTGTLLFHGVRNESLPTTAEWAAFDVEFARLFCDEQCLLMSLVATRPLRILYFDGSSATKIFDGPMDAQDLLAWGAVLPERATVDWEYERLHRLCDFADTMGIDGYVRMQLNFEVMLCDFTAGVRVASLSKLEQEPLIPHLMYAFMHSGAWHDHYPGEMRIQLDLTHAVSLYDVDLAPSLVPRRHGLARREHRVLGIGAHDAQAVAERVRAIPASPSQSGIDWRALFQVIRARYATRLEVLQSILHEDTSPHRAFVLIKTALAPYRVHAAVPSATRSDVSWATPVFRLCATTYTLFDQTNFTASEHVLLTSARETTREICRTLVGIWAEGILELRDSLTPKWRADVDRLVDWLGWAEWLKCRPACAFDESCYLPGAPFSMAKWNVSEPRCMRLFEPYTDIYEPYVL